MKIALRLFAGFLVVLSVSVVAAWAWDQSDARHAEADLPAAAGPTLSR